MVRLLDQKLGLEKLLCGAEHVLDKYAKWSCPYESHMTLKAYNDIVIGLQIIRFLKKEKNYSLH